MLHAHVEKQAVVGPIILGLVALGLSASASAIGVSAASWSSELVILLAPLAFGLRGGALVIGVAVLPMFLNPASYPTAIRLSILVTALGLSQTLFRAVPAYTTALLVWLACVPPALEGIAIIEASVPAVSPESLVMLLAQDVLLAAVAGSLLFNESLWWLLTKRARYLRGAQLLPHLMTATALSSLFAVGIFLNSMGLLDEAFRTPRGMALGTALIAIFALIPTVVGFHIGRVVRTQERSHLLGTGANSPELSTGGDVSREHRLEDSWDIAHTSRSARSEQSTSSRPTLENDVGVCAVDESGAVLFMNERFKGLASVTTSNPVGMALADLSCSTELIHYIRQTISSTDPSREFVEEIRVSGRSDNVKFLEINLCPHTVTGESHDGTSAQSTPRVIRLSDITARRTIDDGLSRIQRNKTLSACAAGSAPQLSEIFTTILGHASYALHVQNASALSSALQSIQDLAVRGGALSRHLNELTVAPDQASRGTLDANAAIGERRGLFQGLVGDSIEVVVQGCPEKLPVRVDSALLTQATSLVVMNAAEAYQDGHGRVTISLGIEEIDELLCRLHPGSRPGSYARISISDHGRGMPAEVLARVANPLLTVRGEYGHVGLDLPSVLAVMSEHDGFMTVESKPERGTTVSLFLPLVRGVDAHDTSETLVEAGVTSATSPATHSDTRVLIVEDSPSLRSLLHEMVKSLGYCSTTCGSKEDALKLLQSAPVDILLVEESLPGLAAHELVSEAHAHDSHVKTVFLSSSQNKQCEESDAVLLKPFDLGALAQKLAESEKHARSSHGLDA